MLRKHYVSALPEPDRESLDAFLSVFNSHPNLAHFRALVRTAPERQLARVPAYFRRANQNAHQTLTVSTLIAHPIDTTPEPIITSSFLLQKRSSRGERSPDPRRSGGRAQFLNDPRISCYESTPAEHELARLMKTNH